MLRVAVLLSIIISATVPSWAQDASPSSNALFDRENLVAWCVVPFDSRKRGPEARADMLTRMGVTKLAYDWRAEHVPTFDEELETLKRWGIELSAFWFPAGLNNEAQIILDCLRRHEVETELWVSMHGGEIACSPEEQEQRIREHAAALRPIVDAAAEIGCTVGLYNHGGWFGEPENQIAIIAELDADNVGIVYNLHHGHHHLARFPELLEKMLPYLLCLNLNGMTENGDAMGKKILPLGMGEYDLELLRTIRDSGYGGPIGILGHTMDDAEETVRDNLDGLDWLVKRLKGIDVGPRPPLRVGRDETALGAPSFAPAFGRALAGSMVADGNVAYGEAPITVECRARLDSKSQYNILAANDTKTSGAHWEIFTENGSGHLAVYTPGREPDHLRTDIDICDGEWRHIGLQYDGESMRLFIDGELSAEQAHRRNDMPVMPGGFAMGRLVEGGFFCDGLVDDIRIRRGIHEIEVSDGPATKTDDTLGIWNFDDLPTEVSKGREAEVEDPERRAALPTFQSIPAAETEALTPALRTPGRGKTWTRSHGGHGNSRYSAATQITKANVSELTMAWEYRSGDEPGNIQCNPIVVDGLLIAPTSGQGMVALDAATGEEQWRFEPEGRPAHRGLVYWPGDRDHSARILLPAGEYFYALDPSNGKPIAEFGEGGRIRPGRSVVAPVIYKNLVIFPGLLRDVWAYDVRSGERIWQFNTIPAAGEYGRDTWNEPKEGANCWGGMALDEERGIAYIATGSPKPNFAGNAHTGQNLFANCVVALDAESGERLWHFQEIRHDIWDLDVPAPPNLVSIEREGKLYDAVAQVTKLGNTLLLDRVTGEPLFPFRVRRARVSRLPGERTWPYQPDVELPEPFARQEFTIGDVTERTPEARAAVLSRIEGVNYGWFEPFEEDVPTVLYGIHGGAEWTGAAYDPEQRKLYVSSNNIPWMITVFRPDVVRRDPNAEPTRGERIYQANCAECHGPNRFGVGMNPPLHGLTRRTNDDEVRALLANGRNAMPAAPETLTQEDIDALVDFLFLRDVAQEALEDKGQGEPVYTHNGYPKLLDDEGYPGVKPPWGTLNCLDLDSGKLDWQVPLGYYPELAIWGADDTGAENFGGPSVTATGLVFCAGTPDNLIRAFDADTGEVLWEHPLPFAAYAPPTIYEAEGRQFVVVPSTGGGKLGGTLGDAYVAFALPATNATR